MHHCIHTVGPRLGHRKYTWDQAVAKLAGAYRNVLRQFARFAVSKAAADPAPKGTPVRLRLLPISGGTFAGEYKQQIAPLTLAALQAGIGLLTEGERGVLAMEVQGEEGEEAEGAAQIELCVFLAAELADFHAAMAEQMYPHPYPYYNVPVEGVGRARVVVGRVAGLKDFAAAVAAATTDATLSSKDEDTLRAMRAASAPLQKLWPGEAPRLWKGVTWLGGRVDRLRLQTSQSMETLPPEIGQLQALTWLNLAGCELTTLPREIGQLRALTTLDLRSCPLVMLPREIGQLRALTTLDLRSCPLVMLPPEIGQLEALTLLILDNCEKLVALPPEIGQLQALTKLYANSCSQLKAMPLEIGQLLALTAFELRGCPQLTLAPGAKKGQPAYTIVAAYAPLLIVEPRKDNPDQLHAFLLEKPLAVSPFFKSILTNAAYSDWLGKAVKATPSLARLTDADGRRAIDVAHSECRHAMNAALVAAEKAMEGEPKPSATAAVALALALAATAVAVATATEPEPNLPAPSTKDFDLFISHFTKDNSHTVYPTRSTWRKPLLSAGTTVPIQYVITLRHHSTGLTRDRRAWTFMHRGLCTKRNALYLPTPPCRFSKLSAPL